jgi:hypothetical protein
MLKLKTNNCSWRYLVVFFVKYGMSSSDEAVVPGASIERNTIHEAVRFDEMLLHGSLVPNLVDRFFVRLAELISGISNHKKAFLSAGGETDRMRAYSGFTSSLVLLWSCHLNSPL